MKSEPLDKAAEEKVRAARAKAAFLRPYFAHALYALVLRQSNECPTMGVDKWARLYFNTDFVHRCSVDELATVFMHEIGHLLRKHHQRAHALGITVATHKIANVAQDAELNDDIRKEVAEHKDIASLPGNCWYPEMIGCPEGEVWEVYYAHLMDNIEQFAKQVSDSDGTDSSKGDKAPGEGADGGDGGEGKDGKGKGKQGKGAGSTGSGGSDPKDRKHQCGSGADNVKRSWEEGDPGTTGKEGVADADWRDIERHTAQAIADQEKKTRGSVPGGWVTWAEEVLRPNRIPWDIELAGALRWAVNDVAGMVIHSYKRPSRRQHSLPDVILPTMRRPVPRVAIVGDTSGSMSDKDLALVRGTISDICASLGATVIFIATDAAVHSVQRIHDGRNAEMAGRGGTNMVVGIECAMNDVRPKPDVIVVLTDCETGWPAEDPGIRVVVGAIRSNEDAISKIPDWARVVRIVPEGTSS